MQQPEVAPEPAQHSTEEGQLTTAEDANAMEVLLPSSDLTSVPSSERFAALTPSALQRLWLSVPKALLKVGSKGVNASHKHSLQVEYGALLEAFWPIAL